MNGPSMLHASTNGSTVSSPSVKVTSISDVTVNGSHANEPHANGSHANESYANGSHINGSHTNGSYVNGSHANESSLNGVHITNKAADGMATARTGDCPIAICGMAVRLPGGLHTPQQLWDFLLAKGDARTRVPESRYNISAFYSPSGKAGTIKTEYGYFLDESVNLRSFDASFFALSRAELERTDPQQRQMLEVTRECMEDAGVVNWRGLRIGCYMGSFGEDWCEISGKEAQQYGMYRVGGYGDFMLSSRVSYEMDLRGPSMTIRTGCSAALVALHEACVAISNGDCTSAIVGGANLIMAPNMTTSMTAQGVLSPDGSCKTFSADANGFARGEAINAVYIKPLSDAIRDGNPIRAVIRSTATNNDGRTAGISTPSTESQEAMMRRAYQIAGITDFSQTAFVECHGTGTSIGDPMEANAVARIFGDSGVYIGSVKPNLGHSEGASGLTSLIKAVLALENQIIPPNIKFSKPNPSIPFESRRLTVPTEPTSWPESRRERVSINSFGIGGSNAHVILDSARSFNASPIPKKEPETPQLLLYSANSSESLKIMIDDYQKFVDNNTASIGDLAYTLANRREHLQHRAFVVVNKYGDRIASPIQKVGKVSDVIMIFSGQGAQWPLMGRELLQSNLVFQSSIRSLDKYLQDVPFAPEWKIEEELLKPAKSSRLSTAEISQPLSTAIQIALVDTLASVGIEPSAVVGHSSGEIAAAYAVGALTAKEAITVAFYRGIATKNQNRAGAMAAVGIGWEEVEKFLLPNVTVACENSPNSVTLSGDADELNAVVANIQESRPDVFARMLKVDRAYHSYHMTEIGDDYYALIEQKVVGKVPTKPFFSCVSGGLLNKSDNLGPRYWQKNLESPVLFRTAIASILQHQVGQNPVFFEIGPHSVLAGPLRQTQIQCSSTAPYISAMVRNQNCIESFLIAMGKIYAFGVQIDLKALIPTGHTIPDLPRYPWDHSKTYWYESRLSKEWRQRQHPQHDLLGVRLPESTDFDPAWRNLFLLDSAAWVRDHKIKDDIVFPFAAYASMAGEAVRQISGIEEAFSLQHVIVSTALVLTEGKPVEMMTTFRRHRLTDSLDSQWWEFTIASHNGHVWTKHCTGQVKALAESPRHGRDHLPLPRKVASRKCYNAMGHAGLNYGPEFQCLEDIKAATTEQIATAKALNRRADKENYHLHPTLIDASLQLLSVAATKGYTQKHGMMIPTTIEELTVYRSYSDITIATSAEFTGNFAIIGEGECVADGNTVLRMSGTRLSLLEEGDPIQTSESEITARVEWEPHIDFVDIKELIIPSIDFALHSAVLSELAQLCFVLSQRQLAGLKSNLYHMQKFQAWIDRQLQCNGPPPFADISDENLLKRVESIVHQLSATPHAATATAMSTILSNITSIFSGEIESLEILLADELLIRLYAIMEHCERTPFIRLLAHSKPNLRILEVGAGTGASTGNILQGLVLPDGRTSYSKYSFTDISSAYFVSAKERFKAFPNIEYATLDISKNPEEQGFEGRQYDLIIATNVIHATKSLQETLRNVRKLLHVNGRLLLHELNSSTKWVNYIFGILPGWWSGEDDDRADEPYVSTKRWESELVAAGFEGLDAVILDSEEPFQLHAVMVAKPQKGKSLPKDVTLLCSDDTSDPGPILEQLENKGYKIHKCLLNEAPPPGQDVIALVDKDRPFFENIDSTRFESLKSFINNLNGSAILWVTQPSQISCKDPRYAPILGAARTIRSEMSIDFATCEVDDIDSSSDLIVEIFRKFQMREEDETLKPDFEYAICNRKVNIGRYYPFSLNEELLTSELDDRIFLNTDKPGRLDSLHWSRKESEILQGDTVEVETYSAGLNFRDVLGAMGIVGMPERGLGLEAAGIVRRTGPNVERLKIGDRVMLIAPGSFSSLVITSEQLCSKIPDALGFDDAATMPCVYATAIYSIFNIGRLEKGQSILIHSACGGIGIAAIQLAQMTGAEIYATVGNDEKVKYLMETFNLPRNRIFNSRNKSFVDDLMRETRGQGADLVLNSLSGELLHASWRCVAAFGKMVEIGKRDLIGAGKLDMDVFLENRSYCCVDLDQICAKKKSISKELLNLIIEYFQAGHISPIKPTTVFSAASIQDAFRYMQHGKHIGKIVVSIRDSLGSIKLDSDIAKRKKTVEFDNTASYLLVGGLGGLGRSISTWMVEHNARRLIYLSRTAGIGSGDQAFIQELESMGCDVQLVKGSVSNAEDVKNAVERAQGCLKGIIQMSMVIRDQNFSQMSPEEWNMATSPKVQGTWNLHNVTMSENVNLDFFVLFSSISGTIGLPGQANYAAANTFLDAFAQYRTSLGLPVSAIDIGPVEDIGFLSGNDNMQRRLKAAAFYCITEQELLEAITAAIIPMSNGESGSSKSGSKFVARNNFLIGLVATTPLSSPSNYVTWKKDIRMAIFHNSISIATQSSESNDILKSFLAKARTDASILKSPESAALLAVEIGKKVFSFLLKPEEDLQTSSSLSNLGMDSLVAIEMRSWWKQIFGFDISVLEMLGIGTLDALGQHAADGLLKLMHGESEEVNGSN